MTALPEPLTPADCNLRGLPFMPMMVAQVMQSETFGLSNGDEFKAAFTLWCASWLEVPAASLPNDDRMLEFLSRAKSWKKVKAMALRGWVLCADGRLYHAVIAERAMEAWDKRTVYRDKEDTKTERQRRWREQCKQLAAQLHDLGVVPPKGASLETLRGLLEAHGVDTQASTNVDTCVDGRDAGEMPKRETVKGEGELSKKDYDDSTAGGGALSSIEEEIDLPPIDDFGAPAKAPLPMREVPPVSLDPAVQISVALRRQGVNCMSTHPVLQEWASKGVTIDLLTEAVSLARDTKGNDPIHPNYLAPIVTKLLNPPPAAAPGQHAPAAPAKKRKPTGMDPKGTDESYEAYDERIRKAEAQRRQGQP